MTDRKYDSPTRELTHEASIKSHEILPGLLIGSASQCGTATKNGYSTICVRHERCHVPYCIHSAVLDLETWVASTMELERFADNLKSVWLEQGKKTYVHCFHGIERAPLAVAYAIKRDVTPNISFADVYAFVRRMRPVALDRTLWLEKVP